MSIYEKVLGYEDISDYNPINGEYLMHYGVKGMKWKNHQYATLEEYAQASTGGAPKSADEKIKEINATIERTQARMARMDHNSPAYKKAYARILKLQGQLPALERQRASENDKKLASKLAKEHSNKNQLKKTGKKVIGAIDKALGVEHELKPVSGKTTKISSQKDLDKFNHDRSLKGQIENAGKKVKKKAKKTAKKVGKNLSKSANGVKKYVSKKKKKIEEFFD